VGNVSTLQASRDENWGALIDSARQRNLVVESRLHAQLSSVTAKAVETSSRMSLKLVTSLVNSLWKVSIYVFVSLQLIMVACPVSA
jgi:hypothetical protein